MRSRIAVVMLVVAASACSAGSTPPPTTSANPATQYGQDVQKANQVADQLDGREAELEQVAADLGG